MRYILSLALVIAVNWMPSNISAQDAMQDGGRRSKVAKRDGSQKGSQGRGQSSKATPVAVKDGVATLSPENTKVSFVGTHVGTDPKPRLGGFKKFSGKLMPAEDGKSIKSLSMKFETNSLYTELGGNLTSHLKNADFLDVEKYPESKFVSTKIEAGDQEGMFNVIGDFTLMGKTNSITIPVTMKNSDQGILVNGELKLDRTSFGMSKMTERVSKEVSITLSIGERTGGDAPQDQTRGGRGGRGRGGPGGFDLTGAFNGMDKNGDGKLMGDEVPERMRDRLENLDSDGDDAITLKELQQAMQRLGGGRGQGGGR